MVVPYRIHSAKSKPTNKPKRPPRRKSGSATPQLALLCDEHGNVLEPPDRRWSRGAPRSLLFAQALLWAVTSLPVSDGLGSDSPPDWNPNSPVMIGHSVLTGSQDLIWLHDPAGHPRLTTDCKEEITRRFEWLKESPALLRSQPPHPPQWKHAYGSERSRLEGARYYLGVIDHEQAEYFDPPAIVLAKAICNLRNYYALGKEQTIELIRRFYNPRCRINWSAEDVGLTWDLVERFVPSLWLADDRYLSERRAAAIRLEVGSILDRLTPGGKIPVEEMRRLLAAWDPSLSAAPRELGKAMKALTGKVSKGLNGVPHYYGFQLPFDDDFSVEIPDSLIELMASWRNNRLPSYEPPALRASHGDDVEMSKGVCFLRRRARAWRRFTFLDALEPLHQTK